MKVICLINFPDDVEKTNTIFQNMTDAASKNDIELRIEVGGLENEENPLTVEEIEACEKVIIISDTELPMTRFENKKVIEVKNEAEINYQGIMDQVLEEEPPKKAEEDSVVETQIEEVKVEEEKVEEVKEEKMQVEEEKVENIEKGGVNIVEPRKEVYTHLFSGVLAIVPLIIVGGLLAVIANCFGLNTKDSNEFVGAIASVSSTVFAFIIPILSGFIAYSIADRVGFVTGLVGGAFVSVIGTGFLGGILVGLIAGYLSKWLIGVIKMPDIWNGFKLNILVPLITIFILGLFMIYFVNPFTLWLYQGVENWIGVLGEGNVVLLGAMIGLFVAFDVGGPFSKATIAACSGMFVTGLAIPQAAAFGAAMVAPLGLALATVIAKDKFTPEEKETGKAAWLLGLSGLTEGAIPFAAADPIRIIPSIMVGSSATGALIGLFGSSVKIAGGGLFALTVGSAFTGIVGLFSAVIIGVIITAFLVKYVK